MKTSTLKGAIYWELLQVMLQAKHRIMELAETHGLTLMQCNALVMLKPGQPVPMNMLSSILSCDASNITGIVDRLESHGLLERQNAPGDRRVKMVALTSAGADARDQIMKEVAEIEDSRLNQVLSSDERTEFKRLLEKMLPSGATVE